MTRPNNKLTKRYVTLIHQRPPNQPSPLLSLALIVLYRKRLRLAFVGEDATQNIFIIAKVTYTIFTGQGVGSNGPMYMSIAETQN